MGLVSREARRKTQFLRGVPLFCHIPSSIFYQQQLSLLAGSQSDAFEVNDGVYVNHFVLLVVSQRGMIRNAPSKPSNLWFPVFGNPQSNEQI